MSYHGAWGRGGIMAEETSWSSGQRALANSFTAGCKTTARNAGRRSSCRNGLSISTAIACAISGNVRRAAIDSRRWSRFLKHRFLRPPYPATNGAAGNAGGSVSFVPTVSRACRQGSGRERGLASLGRCRFLLAGGAGGRGQLQYGCTLAFTKAGEQHHLAVREFQRIVMSHRVVHVDLPKTREALADPLVRKDSNSKRRLAFHIRLERNLGARKQADRDVRLSDCGKTTRDGIAEFGHDQLVLDPGGPGCDVVQTVVTHHWSSFSSCSRDGPLAIRPRLEPFTRHCLDILTSPLRSRLRDHVSCPALDTARDLSEELRRQCRVPPPGRVAAFG